MQWHLCRGTSQLLLFPQVFLTTSSQPVFVVIVVVKKPFSFSTSLAYKANSSSRILSSFSDFSRGNSVTSAPLLCCLFAFLSQSSLAFFSFTKSFQGLGTHLGFFCDLFLRSCCYKILSLILLVSLSEVYSNSRPNFVGSGDAPLAFASSLLCYRNLPSSKSNLSLTTL